MRTQPAHTSHVASANMFHTPVFSHCTFEHFYFNPVMFMRVEALSALLLLIGLKTAVGAIDSRCCQLRPVTRRQGWGQDQERAFTSAPIESGLL